MQTSIDAFLDGRFTLEQPCTGPRTGLDALLLAAIVPCLVDRRERVLDAGCGCAPIALSIATRFPLAHITGVERESKIVDLARRNVAHNDMEKSISIIEADLIRPLGEMQGEGEERRLEPQSFQHVVANPPFYRHDQSRVCKDERKSAAHRLQDGELAQWIRFLTAMAAPKGSISLIHRPEALPELLELCKGRFGGLKIAPVFSTPDSAAIRILVQGTKGSRAPLALMKGVVLREEDGSYNVDMEAVLREGKPLRL